MIVSLKYGIMAAGVGFHHGRTVFEMIFYAAKLEIDMLLQFKAFHSLQFQVFFHLTNLVRLADIVLSFAVHGGGGQNAEIPIL